MNDERTGDRRPVTGHRKSSLRLGSDIADRLLKFAVAVVRLTTQLPKDAVGRHVGSQLLRAATGAGANYEEARAAESRDDFIHKVGVSAKELRESIFWLALILESRWTKADLDAAIREAEELAAILGASIRTAKATRS